MLTTTVLLLALPLAGLGPLHARDACDDVVLNGRSKGGSTTHISDHHSGDRSSRRIRVHTRTSTRCTEAVIVGDVEFADDERSVTRVGAGGMAMFRERLKESDWMVRYASGATEPTVMRDGRRAPFDAAAQAWLAGFLPEVLREASVDVPRRVARLYREGGAERVLADVAKTRSGGAKRAHYVALLDTPGLPVEDTERTVRAASHELDGNSGDLRAVLQHVPASARRAAPVRAALAAGVVRIDSDGDRAAVLREYVSAGDRDMLIAALGAVRSIDSDGDKRSVLVSAAPHALGDDDGAARDAWFAAATGIDSDGDLRAVLVSALSHPSPAVTEAVIGAVSHIESDGDAAAVLLRVARGGLLTTPALRERYLAAARQIRSDGDYRRVVDAVLVKQ